MLAFYNGIDAKALEANETLSHEDTSSSVLESKMRALQGNQPGCPFEKRRVQTCIKWFGPKHLIPKGMALMTIEDLKENIGCKYALDEYDIVQLADGQASGSYYGFTVSPVWQVDCEETTMFLRSDNDCSYEQQECGALIRHPNMTEEEIIASGGITLEASATPAETAYATFP